MSPLPTNHATGETITASLVNDIAAAVNDTKTTVVNFEDYDAVGDGVADDTAEINAGLTALNAAGGGILRASPGKTYGIAPVGTKLFTNSASTVQEYCLEIPSNVYLDLTGAKVKLLGTTAAILVSNKNPNAITDTNLGLIAAPGSGIIDASAVGDLTHQRAAVRFEGVTGLRLDANIYNSYYSALAAFYCSKVRSNWVWTDLCVGGGTALGTPTTRSNWGGATGTGTTNSTTSVTGVTTSTGAFAIGQVITGTGIPASTTIADISGTTLTLSQAATASGSGVTLTATNPGLVYDSQLGKIVGTRTSAEPSNTFNNPGNPIYTVMAGSQVGSMWADDNDAAVKIDRPGYGSSYGPVFVRGCKTSNSGLKLQGDSAGKPSRVSIGSVTAVNNLANGLYLENSVECSIESYTGRGNGTDGTSADVWWGGQADRVGSITSEGAGFIGLLVRSYSLGGTIPALNVTNQGRVTNGPAISDSGGRVRIGAAVLKGDGTAKTQRGLDITSIASRSTIGYFEASGFSTENYRLAPSATPLDGAQAARDVWTDGSVTYGRIALKSAETVINVRDKGAIGDGVADDTTAIAAAITAAGTRGIYLPAGTYLISSRLALTTGLTIQGAGPNASTLKPTTNANLSTGILGHSGTVNNVTLRDFGIDGNGTNQSATSEGICFGTGSGHTLKNLYVANTQGRGVFPFGTTDMLIEGCRFTNIGVGVTPGTIGTRSAIGLWQGSTRMRVVGNQITDCADSGIHLGGTAHSDAVIANNVVRNVVNIGIALGGSGSSRISVTGNVVDSATSNNGIDTGNAVDSTVSGNSVYNCGGGIIGDGGRKMTVSGNTVASTTGAAGSSAAGIHYIGAVNPTDLVITGNLVRDCAAAGIQFQGTVGTPATGASITGNVVKNCGQVDATIKSGIWNYYAQDVVISGNRIYDDQGTKTTDYAINTNAGGACDYHIIEGNDLRGCLATLNLSGSNNVVGNNIGASQTAVLKSRWLPTSAIGETFSRRLLVGNASVLTSGTLYVVGLEFPIPVGTVITSISFRSASTAAATPTNQWFCLIRQSDRSVLAKTTDDTTTAWGTDAVKTLSFSSPYTVTENLLAYVGVVVVATTVPTLRAVQSTAALVGQVPIIAGNSTTALTNPASLGATAAAVTGSGNIAYAYVS